MATENNLIHDGTLLAGADFRNSTYSGSTKLGPSGSYQYLAVRLSTVADRTVLGTTVDGQPIYGILQNKPASGDAADVGIYGTSKVVSGSTAIGAGMLLEVGSSGCMIPYSSAAGVAAAGRSIEVATAVGAIFSAVLFGSGVPVGSVA